MGEDESVQDWQRIEVLLGQALDLTPEQWTAYLDNLSGDDADYRSRLEELLDSAQRADDLLEQPLLKSSRGTIEPGSQIGSYRIERRLGTGGMGEVFEAERSDGAFDMKVAIKLLLNDKDQTRLAQRFQTERQILAHLVHPNIARLFDGGTTDDGRPYLVMELVEGRQLDTYCDDRQLSIDQRLQLFRRVCDAVSYAHRHLVVHRDIKPNNILVDHEGQPKLLDFGIAKILDGSPSKEASQPRTPQYASPEQFLGGAVTTSTDIFSLGVVLYELITGHPYRDHIGLGVPEDSTEKPSIVVQKTIEARSKVITPASVSEPRQTAPHRLPSLLSGDLDSIVLRALGKTPDERYGSVEALAQDIDRHLAGLPIIARGDEPMHKVLRLSWYYRRRIALTAICLLLLCASVLGFQRARQATLQQQRTMALTEFALDIFQVKEPLAPHSELSAHQLLAASSSALELTPEQAPLMGLIGNFYVGLGDYEKAAPILQQAVDLIDRDHPLWIYFYRDLNLVESMMQTNHQSTDSNPSLDSKPTPMSLERPVGDTWSMDGDPPDNINNQHFIRFLSHRALNLYQQGSFEESIGLYKEALALAVDLPSTPETVETIQQNLATSYERLGRTAEAKALLEDVLAKRRRRPTTQAVELVNSLRMLSILLQSSFDVESLGRAEQLARQALEVETRSPEGASAMTLTTLATAKRLTLWLPFETASRWPTRQTVIEEAEAYLWRALALEQQALEADETGSRGTAAIRTGLSILAQERGAFDDALSLAESARDTLLACCYSQNHWRVAEAESVLGGAHLGLGNVDKATSLMVRSLEVLETTRGDAARPTLEARRRLERLMAAAR